MVYETISHYLPSSSVNRTDLSTFLVHRWHINSNYKRTVLSTQLDVSFKSLCIFYSSLSILATSISPITIAFEHLIILNIFILITSLKKLEVLLSSFYGSVINDFIPSRVEISWLEEVKACGTHCLGLPYQVTINSYCCHPTARLSVRNSLMRSGQNKWRNQTLSI